jgi:hypothetical protein
MRVAQARYVQETAAISQIRRYPLRPQRDRPGHAKRAAANKTNFGRNLRRVLCGATVACNSRIAHGIEL